MIERARICQTCTGLMLLDPDDRDGLAVMKCASCGRSDFTPSADALERVELFREERTAHASQWSSTGRSDRSGSGTIPTGVVIPFGNY